MNYLGVVCVVGVNNNLTTISFGELLISWIKNMAEQKQVEKVEKPRLAHLRSVERRVQKQWEDSKPYEAEMDLSRPKFFLNFPYPYMNGRLHLGHAFSLTKAEFTARFQRLQGKNVLFPFGFHCTGMPIQAAANKLREELAKYGNPPDFKKFDLPEAAAADDSADGGEGDKPPAAPAAGGEQMSAEAQIAAKSKGKKQKLVNKGIGGSKPKTQWEIMQDMNVPRDEIASFADPLKWLSFFPPFGAQDLKAFGSAIDWRRSFITTSINPFYDAFIRWQFNRLKEGGRIKFGKRANVYSVVDGQVCADHDRASGEGVGPQEYTIIKLLVRPEGIPADSPLKHPSLAGKKIYLAPATLRPETMYGQTNCFVLPDGNYGAFEVVGGDVLIVSERAARGMAHQGLMSTWGKAEMLVAVKGWDLLGLPLQAPNAVYETVYTLPLVTISMSKGTGVVTSVPSDAPDDYVALKELKDKPEWRSRYKIEANMVEPFEVVPIIDIEGYGTTSAVFMCEKLKIASCKDTDKLKAAKDEVYLKGYYEGVMMVGECKGMKVCDAKPVIRATLIERGDALSYYEPESLVMSRSGDECVVALTDQWYLSYGDAEWAGIVSKHIHSPAFNGYNDKIMEKFDEVLGWLKEWACSRQFGLGTRLPWDDQWVIESLSDSTIYMAYYTIAHYLHGSVDNLAGPMSPSGIRPEDLTDYVFSFIFLAKPLPAGVTSAISESLLLKMRAEFEYWYPWDLRVSAKDLIPNHLTMSLYNHVEVWKGRPQFWPRGIYCNGHIMVDAEKMSKSKGNFLSLLDTVERFSADATRFACADAGDSMEDANFDMKNADEAVSKLFVEEEWFRKVLQDRAAGKLRAGEMNLMDSAFNNEIDFFVEATFNHFERMCYRDGLQCGWFGMMIARDVYRDWAVRSDVAMHQDVVLRFIRAVVVMMSPITPHWSENLWADVRGEGIPTPRSASVCDAAWPSWKPYDRFIRKQYTFFLDVLKVSRQQLIKTKLPAGPKAGYVFIASRYEPNKIRLLKWMQTLADPVSGALPADFIQRMKAYLEAEPELKPSTKALMQFGAFMRDEARDRGIDALDTEMPFDQKALLEVSRWGVVAVPVASLPAPTLIPLLRALSPGLPPPSPPPRPKSPPSPPPTTHTHTHTRVRTNPTNSPSRRTSSVPLS